MRKLPLSSVMLVSPMPQRDLPTARTDTPGTGWLWASTTSPVTEPP